MRRPNILLIMTDNQPADMLGCAGALPLHTPHIDALADQGLRFTNAFCVNAMCSPCRASVLTGLMPGQHGVHNWLDDSLSNRWPDGWCAVDAFATLPRRLKQAGYATALIGKFHLGDARRPQLGFDHWVTLPHGHTTTFHGNRVIEGNKPGWTDDHTVDWFAARTVDWLETRRDAPEPFFAFVPFNGPYGHWPAIAGRARTPFAALYDDADLSAIPREGLNPAVLDRFAQRVAAGGLREQFKGPLMLPNNLDALRNYCAQVSVVDAGVGRIRAALDRLGLARDTLIVFTADHGFSLGHHGIWGHGAAAFPASMHRPSYHIPLIVAGGPVTARGTCDGLVSQIDLFPTLAATGGADPQPSGPSAARDLTPILQGAPPDPDREIFLEQEESRALRTRRWLYVARTTAAPDHPFADELYDLQTDPEERQNRIDDPGLRNEATDLRTRLDNAFATHADPAFDLWQGGTAQSNVTFAPLWQNAWGPDWHPRLDAELSR